MGLNHWGESDGAADFVYTYKEATTMAKRRKLIDTELKDFANNYNTPGSVNIALAIEGGILRKEDLTEVQLYTLRDLLTELKVKSSAKYRKEWSDESGRIEHNNAYKRLLKAVKVDLN